MCSSKYFNKLDKECKARYLSKIAFIDSKDPYALPRGEFLEDPVI